MKSLVLRTCGFLLVFASAAGMAQATFQTPEIAPDSLSSALTLLTGGALILTERFRRR
jgi:hypothetical protein